MGDPPGIIISIQAEFGKQQDLGFRSLMKYTGLGLNDILGSFGDPSSVWILHYSSARSGFLKISGFMH